ncbi:MAG TPA: hypothetical protein VFV49_15430 [Thermoanaerobaculia bacterium]|nr:hypothetical protein [Thermoanaerobaculia bacterium]
MQILRLPVRSRRWNWALAILGAIYAVSAIALLVWFVIDVWNAAGIPDRILQFALLGSALYGIWVFVKALENLGIRSQRRWHAQRVSRSTAQ